MTAPDDDMTAAAQRIWDGLMAFRHRRAHPAPLMSDPASYQGIPSWEDTPVSERIAMMTLVRHEIEQAGRIAPMDGPSRLDMAARVIAAAIEWVSARDGLDVRLDDDTSDAGLVLALSLNQYADARDELTAAVRAYRATP